MNEFSNASAQKVAGHGDEASASGSLTLILVYFIGIVTVLLGIHHFITPVWFFQHMAYSQNPFIFAEDARQQVWPFLKFHDPGLFSSDPIAAYYLDAFFPQGFLYGMKFFSMIADPRMIAKILPYILFAFFVVIAADTARRLGGVKAGLGCMVLILGTDFFLFHMTGGLPRNFALPLTALLAWGLVCGRVHVLSFTVVLASGFYYVIAFVGGITMAAWLLLLPFSWQPPSVQDWSRPRRIALLSVTALLCLAIFMPSALKGRQYGPMLGPDSYQAFPEAGPRGRYYQPRSGMVRKAWQCVTKPFHNDKTPMASLFGLQKDHPARKGVLLVLMGLTAAGVWPVRHRRSWQGLFILAAVSLGGYLMADQAFPYLFYPERYVKYTLPTIWVILMPASFMHLTEWGFGKQRARFRQWAKGLCLAGCLMVVFLLGQRDALSVAFHAHVTEDQEPVIRYVAGLPRDAVIAGWPLGLMDNIPYAAARQVLLNYETHQMFHRHWVENRRTRMNALIDALWATEPGPLIRLKNEFNVTHLVIQPDRLYESVPKYFAPFDERIRKAAQELGERVPLVMQLPETAYSFKSGGFQVIDLTRPLGHPPPGLHQNDTVGKTQK